MDTTTDQALRLYKKTLEKIITIQEIKVQKEKDKHAENVRATKEEYPTEDDIMTACGYGFITEYKKNKLLELFRNEDNANKGQTVNGLYLHMLKLDLKSIKIQLRYPAENEQLKGGEKE